MSYIDDFKSFSRGEKILASDLDYNFNLIKSNSIEIRLFYDGYAYWDPKYSSSAEAWYGYSEDGLTNWFTLLGSPTSISEFPDAVIFKFETPTLNDALSKAISGNVSINLSQVNCLSESGTLWDGQYGRAWVGSSEGEVIATSMSSYPGYRDYTIGAPFYHGATSGAPAIIRLGFSQSSSSGWFPYLTWGGGASSNGSYHFEIKYKCYGIYLLKE